MSVHVFANLTFSFRVSTQ